MIPPSECGPPPLFEVGLHVCRTLGPKYRNATTANLGSAELGSGSGSGRKLVNKVLATVSNKRKVGTEESSQPISNKRHRSEDVIVIDSDSEGATNPAGDHPKLTTAFGGRNGNPEDLEELNHVEVINKFKLDPKKLSWVRRLVVLDLLMHFYWDTERRAIIRFCIFHTRLGRRWVRRRGWGGEL